MGRAKSSGLLAAGLAVAGMVAVAWAADTAPRRPATPGHAGETGMVDDQALATMLLLDNEIEVQVSQIAVERAQDPQVKQFAQQMVQDHRQMIEQLRQVAGMGADQSLLGGEGNARGAAGRGNATGAREGNPGATDAGNRNRNTEAGNADGGNPNAGNPNAGNTDAGNPNAAGQGNTAENDAVHAGAAGQGSFISLKRELAQQCLQTARRELEQKEGHEFDQCYLGMQIAQHMHAVDALTVFSRHASGQLRQTVEQALPTVQQHLQMVKQLMKTAETQTRGNTNR